MASRMPDGKAATVGREKRRRLNERVSETEEQNKKEEKERKKKKERNREEKKE